MDTRKKKEREKTLRKEKKRGKVRKKTSIKGVVSFVLTPSYLC